MNNGLMTMENVQNVLQELEKAFHDIPFENSAFQNRAFVMAAQLTPERAYRAIGLRMFAKIRALKEAAYGRRKEDVEIRRRQAIIDNENADEFDREIARIEIEEKMEARAWTDKLINDALAELNTLYAEFKKYPQFTREQFEQGEQAHFEKRLNRQLKVGEGAAGALTNMHVDLHELPFLTAKAYEQLGMAVPEMLRLEMSAIEAMRQDEGAPDLGAAGIAQVTPIRHSGG